MLSVVSVWVQWQDTAVWTAIAMYGGAASVFAARILLYHGAARLLGRNGSMKSLAAALCFTELPLNLATLAGSFVFVAPELLVQAVSLAAGVWALVLDVWLSKKRTPWERDEVLPSCCCPWPPWPSWLSSSCYTSSLPSFRFSADAAAGFSRVFQIAEQHLFAAPGEGTVAEGLLELFVGQRLDIRRAEL